MKPTYEDIAQYVESGMEPAAILAELQDDPRHVRDIPATGDGRDLLELLGEFYVLYTGNDGGWRGPLISAVEQQVATLKADPDPAVQMQGTQLEVGFGRLLSNLQAAGRTVHTRSKPEIGRLTNVLTGIVGAIVDQNPHDSRTSADVESAVNSLTGGRIFAGATLDDVNDSISRKNASDAWDEFRSLQEFVDSLFESYRTPSSSPPDKADYRQRLVDSAALTQLFVDPDNGNDTTGDGTEQLPFASWQGAYDSLTRGQ